MMTSSALLRGSLGLARVCGCSSNVRASSTVAVVSALIPSSTSATCRRIIAHIRSGHTSASMVDPQALDHTRPLDTLKFYDTSVEAAVKKSKELVFSVGDLLRFCNMRGSSKMIKSAQFLKESLTCRIAQRLQDFQKLPLIVVSNPHLKTVYSDYANAFAQLKGLSPITNEQDERAFTDLMIKYMDDHQVVIDHLREGSVECRALVGHLADLNQFIARTVSSRIGIRLLISQQIALHSKHGEFGVFQMKLSPKEVIESCARSVEAEVRASYGRCPRVEFKTGETVRLTYVRSHLEYIVTELLRNSFVSCAKRHSVDMMMPPVEVTVCGNEEDVIIRLSDQGGGISNQMKQYLWSYIRKSEPSSTDSDAIRGRDNGRGGRRKFDDSGLGFGLPMSRAYAEYFGGDLTVISMHGYGCDVYLRLKRLDVHADALSII